MFPRQKTEGQGIDKPDCMERRFYQRLGGKAGLS
jgi:hypothetical protein